MVLDLDEQRLQLPRQRLEPHAGRLNGCALLGEGLLGRHGLRQKIRRESAERAVRPGNRARGGVDVWHAERLDVEAVEAFEGVGKWEKFAEREVDSRQLQVPKVDLPELVEERLEDPVEIGERHVADAGRQLRELLARLHVERPSRAGGRIGQIQVGHRPRRRLDSGQIVERGRLVGRDVDAKLADQGVGCVELQHAGVGRGRDGEAHRSGAGGFQFLERDPAVPRRDGSAERRHDGHRATDRHRPRRQRVRGDRERAQRHGGPNIHVPLDRHRALGRGLEIVPVPQGRELERYPLERVACRGSDREPEGEGRQRQPSGRERIATGHLRRRDRLLLAEDDFEEIRTRRLVGEPQPAVHEIDGD